MPIDFDPKSIDQMVQKEVDHFLRQEPELKADVEYVFKIGIPDRPKTYLMLAFADALDVKEERIMPFAIVADLMMAAAMNTDDIIDDNAERCGEPSLWKTKGIRSAVVVTDYMYAFLFSILKRHRPDPNHTDFAAYQKSENLLLDYFRVMNIAQYKTTVSAKALETFTLSDLEKLAIQKASLLFQFCTAVPAYFAGKHIKASEDFGYQLGIVRQYVSDAHDFFQAPSEHDHNKKGVGEHGARMEDYFTHQPNLILLLVGTSDKINPEEKAWFYNNWMNTPDAESKREVTRRVVELVEKTGAIEAARSTLKKIKKNMELSLHAFSDQEFKEHMAAWAFRSFPLDES